MSSMPPQPPPVPPTGSAQPNQPPYPPPWWTCPPKKKSWITRILLGIGIIIFIGSILMNLVLLAMVGSTLGATADTLRPTVLVEGDRNQIVAVYAVQGAISAESAADFHKFVNTIKKNNRIKAIVMRVDSPGGTVAASDEIHHMVQQIRTEQGLPVIVSMGGVAASGGYYISAGADQIFVEPTTITGSIGVISVWPVLKQFLDKHGIEVVTIRSNQSEVFKAAENFWETPDSRTRQNVQDMLTAMHKKFEQVVKDGRPDLNTKEIEVQVAEGKTITETEPLNGKVYLADEAIKWGLADKIGYLLDAANEAAARANLSNPQVVQYAKPKGLAELFSASESESAMSLINKSTAEKLMTPQILMMWKAE